MEDFLDKQTPFSDELAEILERGVGNYELFLAAGEVDKALEAGDFVAAAQHLGRLMPDVKVGKAFVICIDWFGKIVKLAQEAAKASAPSCSPPDCM